MKILILCTGNSCRSQMAEGFLKSFDESLYVRSAGTKPASEINEKAIKVMNDIGIDISSNIPKQVNIFLRDEWDYVITVCGSANESCPAFIGKVKNRIHIPFDDPSEAKGSEEFINAEFVRIRNEIKDTFYRLYVLKFKKNASCHCGGNC